MSDRRSFLRGLVSLPLIGGGVTLIGQPAAAVPLVQAAALPTLTDPRQRARYAWEAFASAMDELTAGASGWRVRGAGRIPPFGCYQGLDYLNLAEVYFEVGEGSTLRRPLFSFDIGNGDRHPGLLIERHREFALDPAVDVLIQESNARMAAHRQARETGA